MFAKPMVVSALHPWATREGTGVRVRFTQEWSSERYHDIGAKE
jgi:hypothetical protein